MAADVYDRLAHAAQAAMAEQEASEEARWQKIQAAFARFGHTEFLALAADPPVKKGHAKEK